MKPTVPTFELLGRLAITIAMLALFGCGGGSDSADREPSGRSTAITFQISVAPSSDQSTRVLTGHAMGEPDICNDYLIDTIGVQVRQTQDDAEVASAQEACAAHSLTITDVPAGKSLYVVCQGYVAGKSVWQGRADGIVAEAGQQTDIGVIDLQYIGRDSTAPEIASTFPAADAANVDVFAPIVVVFTEKLAPSTIPDQAITIINNDIPVPGQVGYDPGSQSIRFMPADAFNPETTYSVTLQTQGDDNGTITDIDGHPFTEDVSWQFTTRGAEDNTPPQVIVTSPLKDATNVAPQTSITALFSEPMDPDSLTDDVFQISSGMGTVSGQIAYDDQNRKLSLTPESALEAATVYTAVISTKAKDLAQNTLLEPYTWQFLSGGSAGPYTITTLIIPEDGSSGSISPANVNVSHGEDQTIDIHAKPYHHLSELIVDGNPVTPESPYYFKNVSSNHTIQAVFKSNAENLCAECPGSHGNAQINDKGQVAWLGNGKVDDEIFFYNGSYTENITEENEDLIGNHNPPQLNSKGDIVWYSRKITEGNQYIYCYNGSDTLLISDASMHYNREPQINSDGHVVWQSKKDVPSGSHAYYYDRGKGLPSVSISAPPASNSYIEDSPQINDNRQVVWSRCPSCCTGYDIYFYDYDTSSTKNITDENNLDGDHYSPQINAYGHVVWSGSNYGNLDIFYYNGEKVTIISEDPEDPERLIGNFGNPQINDNGYVVWQGRKNEESNSDIYYYNGVRAINITEDPEDPDKFSGNYINPKINDKGHVVWEGYESEGSDYDIYFYNGEDVTIISDNPTNDDKSPQINNGGLVVWSRHNGTNFKVFLTSP